MEQTTLLECIEGSSTIALGLALARALGVSVNVDGYSGEMVLSGMDADRIIGALTHSYSLQFPA